MLLLFFSRCNKNNKKSKVKLALIHLKCAALQMHYVQHKCICMRHILYMFELHYSIEYAHTIATMCMLEKKKKVKEERAAIVYVVLCTSCTALHCTI